MMNRHRIVHDTELSKILWHFTGGPKWDTAKDRQEQRPKPMEEA